MQGGAFQDFPGCQRDCCNAGIGRSQYRSAKFDAACQRHVHMLVGLLPLSVPGVIGDIDDKLGSQIGQRAGKFREQAFIADLRTHF